MSASARLDRSHRWVSAALVAAMLGVVLAVFRDFGVTWDEPVQDRYGELVLDYYRSGLRDRSAASFQNLYLYGGAFDSLAVALRGLLPLDRYESRHLLNALVGLLGILGTWRLARLLSGPAAAGVAAAILFLTPSYFGHMFNNPKDIPFAAGYVWSLSLLVEAIGRLPRLPNGLVLRLGLAFGLTSGVRVGGLVLPAYLAAAVALYAAAGLLRGGPPPRRPRDPARWLGALLGPVAAVLVISHLVMLAFWPWAQGRPIAAPLQALSEISRFEWPETVLLAGRHYPAQEVPWTYVPHYLAIKIPEWMWLTVAVALGFAVRFVATRGVSGQRLAAARYALVTAAAVLPVGYAMLAGATVYDEMRHFLFVVPCLAALGGAGVAALGRAAARTSRLAALGVALGLGALLVPHAARMVRLHPNQYVYYNAFVGGVPGAGHRYEMDYWCNSFKEAVAKLVGVLEASEGEAFREREYSIAVLGPEEATRSYLPPNLHVVELAPERPPDFVICTTRWRMHRRCPGRTIVRVEREGVVLSVVKDLRRAARQGRADVLELAREPLLPPGEVTRAGDRSGLSW